MDNQLIDKKIQELRELLEQELPNTAVCFELELTGTSSHYRVSHKYPEQLKREMISMRNIKGDFINWSVKPIGQLCCRWDVSAPF